MLTKSFLEMAKVDVRPHCEMRKAKDDRGREIEVPYLNWAKCKRLLHEHGAEFVNFTPCTTESGSSLFMTDQAFTDNKGNVNRCYEVRVKVQIDDKEFIGQFPLMNGSNPVKDNSMSQQRVWNAQTRAFVKTVAMVTGLGFDLWCGKTEEDLDVEEDLARHSLAAIKERFMQEYTQQLKKNNLSAAEIADKLEMSVDEVKAVFTYFDILSRFEKKMTAL